MSRRAEAPPPPPGGLRALGKARLVENRAPPLVIAIAKARLVEKMLTPATRGGEDFSCLHGASVSHGFSSCNAF